VTVNLIIEIKPEIRSKGVLVRQFEFTGLGRTGRSFIHSSIACLGLLTWCLIPVSSLGEQEQCVQASSIHRFCSVFVTIRSLIFVSGVGVPSWSLLPPAWQDTPSRPLELHPNTTQRALRNSQEPLHKPSQDPSQTASQWLPQTHQTSHFPTTRVRDYLPLGSQHKLIPDGRKKLYLHPHPYPHPHPHPLPPSRCRCRRCPVHHLHQ